MALDRLPKKTVIRADNDVFTVTVKDSDGNVVDITGWEVRMTVRVNFPKTSVTDDTDAAISALGVINLGTDGKAEFNVTSTQTDIDPREYYYDIQTKDDSGVIRSARYGTYEIINDITRDE